MFWLENSIPHQYRDWIRDGVLMWNPAFERVGIKNAIVVKQQPDDADWDPADIRYNTIRWLVSYDATFAIGPSHSNPYTGQKFDADIGFTEGVMRLGARRRYELRVHPVQRLDRMKAPSWTSSQPGGIAGRFICDYAGGLVERASFAYDVMATRPDWSAEKEEKYVREFAMTIAAHEVGHTLGFRHNFRASTINRMDQLADTDRTHNVGLAASVMDYNPPVIALKGERQGDYFPVVVGSYDHWAVEYAYKPIPGAKTPQDELPELRKIGARVAEPLLAYGTDEDAGMSARALDPRNTRFDFTHDPLEWFSHEFKLTSELWANMEAKLVRSGDSYEVLRRAFGHSWQPYFVGSHLAMKYIGGVYHNRDHAADPSGRPPYTPVPPGEQRKALQFLADEIWAPSVFQVPVSLLTKLQFERFVDFEGRQFHAPRLDYPLHDSVLAVQGEVLNDLYHPVKLSRLVDLELMYPDPDDKFTLADMFVGIRDTIWSELDTSSAINGFRRNLQRAHLKQLVQLVLKPKEGTPGDAVALARADLVQLEAAMEGAVQRGAPDYTTQAHLEESRARIRKTLDAHVERVLIQPPKKEE